MASAPTNSWLRAQRKSDLVELADAVGLKNYESLKKGELEATLDAFIAEHAARLAACPDLAGYFASRSRAARGASPVRGAGRRRTAVPKHDDDEPEPEPEPSDDARTPARRLAPLPATPADVAHAVDRSAVAVRRRVSSLYRDSGIAEASLAAREALSTVTSVLFCVAAWELACIRPAILASRYTFSLALGAVPPLPVYLPDMFLLLGAAFWAPALTWTLTSAVLPCLAGYFVNLSASSAANAHRRSPRPARARARAVVDPLTFSIAKALVSYLVYAQRVTFGGLLSESVVARLDAAVYGGWRGMLVGAAITGVVSMYDAVLRK